jgi:hypothetical protein
MTFQINERFGHAKIVTCHLTYKQFTVVQGFDIDFFDM